MPLPKKDFDPTEAAIPWKVLKAAGHEVAFATSDGIAPSADIRMVTGRGLGPWRLFLRADRNGRQAYAEMKEDPSFKHPFTWEDISETSFAGLILGGGHAKGMKEYLESKVLQKVVLGFFQQNKPVGAICHGVVLAARSLGKNGKSVLYGRKTTALPRSMEITAFLMTCLWLGNYYRTYPTTVQTEVKGALESKRDFFSGPSSTRRDTPNKLKRGFVIRDGNYLSARWPGDAHRFAYEFLDVLDEVKS